MAQQPVFHRDSKKVNHPSRKRVPYVHWATRNMLWELLQWGVRAYYVPSPFVHTKLFVVDGAYAQVGSANIDPRSLRLNFELVVEVYDEHFVRRLITYINNALEQATEVSLDDIENRPLVSRFRDALAWLFSPYL